MKRYLTLIVLLCSCLLAACGVDTATQAVNATPASNTAAPVLDRCSPTHLTVEIVTVNKLTDEFDRYSSRAFKSAQSQLIRIIPQLQRVLREAQDQDVPACLQNLKELQTAHMNAMIQVLIYLHGQPMSAASPDPNVAAYVNAAIAETRDLHEKYDVELSRLLDTALVPPPPVSDAAATVQPTMAADTVVIAAIILFLGLLWVLTGHQLIKHTKQTHKMILNAQETLSGNELQNIHGSTATPSSESNEERVLELTMEKQHVMDAYEGARRKLAHQVHTAPMHTIADMAVRLNTTKHILKTDVQAAIEEISKLEELAQSAIHEISRMPVLLRPLTLESQGLAATLQVMADHMKELYDQRVIFNLDADISDQFELDKQNLLFHIIEEAVEHACRHASAEIIAIRLHQTGDEIATLQIVDNGIGFDIHAVDDTAHMVNLRERVKLIQGLLQIDSVPGRGTILQVHIPFAEAAGNRLPCIPEGDLA
jgi:signal transduction histidine kinase